MAFDLESLFGEPAGLEALNFYQYDATKEHDIDHLSFPLVGSLFDDGLQQGLPLDDGLEWMTDLDVYLNGTPQQTVQPCLQLAVVEPLEDDGVLSPSSSCESPASTLLDELDQSQDLLRGILGSDSLDASLDITDDTTSIESLSPEQSMASSPPMTPMKRGRGSKSQKRSVRYSELKGVRKEKKREQNKTAAERYRNKKKTEKVVVSTQLQLIEKRNKDLREQVESAEFELKNMKDLLSQAYGMDVEALKAKLSMY